MSAVSDIVAREEEVVARLVALVRRGKAYLIHFISCGDCVGSCYQLQMEAPNLTHSDFFPLL